MWGPMIKMIKMIFLFYLIILKVSTPRSAHQQVSCSAVCPQANICSINKSALLYKVVHCVSVSAGKMGKYLYKSICYLRVQDFLKVVSVQLKEYLLSIFCVLGIPRIWWWIYSHSAFQSMLLGWATVVPHRNFQEMQIPGPHPLYSQSYGFSSSHVQM